MSGYIFAAEACIDNRKKKLVKQQYLPTCPHNMVNFGPLTAEICWRVWGTPANLNGFRILAALLHGTPVVGVSHTAALNRGRHLSLAGWPSRWASAHILVTFCVSRRRRKMYCGHARLCVCVCVCLSVRGRTPTLLHGPGCNLGAW